VTEVYELIKLNLLEGIIYDRTGYDILTKSYGFIDNRVTPYNVLLLRIKSLKFERIFVFY
jgi:hypothetical protein